MRRFLSITAIMAVASSMLSPLLAAVCPHAQQAAACHRVQAQKPHCSMMHHHHDADAAVPDDETPAFASSSSPSCPMDCCVPGHPTNAVTVAFVSNFSPWAVLEYRVQF